MLVPEMAVQGRETMMANQMGKRYVCSHCSTQLLVVKPGAGALECHGAPMTIETPKPLPASD
jgi:hypothetical protein